MSPVRSESSQAAPPGDESDPGRAPGASAPGARAPGGDAGRLARRLSALLVSLCVVVALWLLLRLTAFEYGLDQGIYATVADVVRDGGAPYRDAWDFKPPGVFFAYALAKAAFGDSMRAVRLLEALAFASLLVAFALYTRRFAGSVWPGLLGGALAVGSHVWMGFWHTAQPESFGAPLLAWALVLATVDRPSPHEGAADGRGAARNHAADAGAAALYALAALMKPPLGGGILVSFGFALRRTRSPVKTTLAYAAGGALPVAAVLLYLASAGALGDLHEALLVFAPAYTALNYQAGDLPGFAVRTLQILFLRFSWLNALGLVLLVALPRLAPREREGALHAAGVLAFCLLGVALQGRFFAYHYGAAVPLLSLLAGVGLFKLARVQERRGLGVAALFVVLALLANSNGVHGPVQGGLVDRLRQLDPGHLYNAPQRRVAAWLRAHTEAGDPIHVFGFRPALYDLADRPPASRFIYNAPQRAPWYSARGRDALMRDLRATPPAAILVEHDDVHPGTAGTAFDSATTLTRFPRLAELVAREYDAGVRVDDFTIHLQRARAAPPSRSADPTAPAPPRDRE